MSKKLTEYQIRLMRVCDGCEERRNFNMKIDDSVTNHDFCTEELRYISLNTIYSNCKYNKVHLNKREPLKEIIKRKMKVLSR